MLLYLTIQKSTRSVDSALIYTEKDSPTFWGAVTLKMKGLNDLYPQWFKMEICNGKDSLGDK